MNSARYTESTISRPVNMTETATHSVQSANADFRSPVLKVLNFAHPKISSMIDGLRSLMADWDGEGAPAPEESAIESAKLFADTIWNTYRVVPHDIEADVLGGVGITYYGSDNRSVSIGFRNGLKDVSFVLLSPDGDYARGMTMSDACVQFSRFKSTDKQKLVRLITNGVR